MSNLIIVSAPSGAGKTSLIKEILQQDKQIKLSVSTTTRPPRINEIDGVHYNFVSVKQFEKLQQQNEFIEFAKVHQNYYGTSKTWVEQNLKQNDNVDILLEIDWQGAEQVKKIFPDAILIFILPPSLQILRQRLTDRKTDSDEVIQNRINAAIGEMQHCNNFDFVIINDDFNMAAKQLLSIIQTQRLTYNYQKIMNPKVFEGF